MSEVSLFPRLLFLLTLVLVGCRPATSQPPDRRGDTASPIPASEALGSQAPASPATEGDYLLRISNPSEVPLDRVWVGAGLSEAAFDVVPARGVSEYEPIDQLFDDYYLHLTVESTGERHTTRAGDDIVVGEPPPSPGRYSLVLHVHANGELSTLLLPDDPPPLIAEGLVGKVWEWREATLADGTHFTPVGVEGPPTIRFTAEAAPDDPGVGLLVSVYYGCNAGSTSYHISQFGKVLFYGGSHSEMDCGNEGVMATEALLTDSLRGISTYLLSERSLTVHVSGRSTTLNFVERAPDDPPRGASWPALATVPAGHVVQVAGVKVMHQAPPTAAGSGLPDPGG